MANKIVRSRTLDKGGIITLNLNPEAFADDPELIFDVAEGLEDEFGSRVRFPESCVIEILGVSDDFTDEAICKAVESLYARDEPSVWMS